MCNLNDYKKSSVLNHFTTYCVLQVFQKIAEEEEHFPKNLQENPDWKMIYLYLVALLKGDEPPEVGQIG